MDDTAPTEESVHVVSERVADALPALSRAERQVGRVLLADYPSAGLSTTAALAQQAGVSPPTVLRFAQSLGFAGFTELQRALREELTRHSSGPLIRLGAPAGDGTARQLIVRDGTAQAERALESLARIPDSSYEAAIDLLTDLGRRIVLTGGRFTYLGAYHLGLHLEQLRPGVRMFNDPGGRDLGAVIELSHRDVLVLFDFHRYQRSAQELAAAATRRGATLLLVTDSLDCPVAPRADVVLDVTSATDHPFQSDTAAFMLTEQLLNVVLERLGEPAYTRLALWDRLREHELLP
ncbi:MurR/RpiR family transcriptional regulator [Tsukamurella soli]|uniref:MurR/RpiR family transcriptional regulator n=1 Tax=Tsukamurella soli TaxID=644556 RepID=A0ABP8JS21_9ACTN